jgi:hypothetical protein
MGYHRRQSDGPPSWFVFLLGVAFIFGAFYLWTSLQSYLRTGGLSVDQATQISREDASATAVQRVTTVAELPTRRPSATPKPDCQDFRVTAATAIMRQQPSTAASLIESIPEGTVVCVLEASAGGDGFTWYMIDRDPVTRLIETAYMREDVIEPANPSPTPSITVIPPTITESYSPTPTASTTPSATATRRSVEPTSTPRSTEDEEDPVQL